MGNRLYKFDNLKAVLIFLVVFGHFLELVQGHRLLYLTIYSFHMPLFIFITGYFAHFDSKKILSGLVFPYCVFQILYTYFERIVLKNENLTLTFLRPRWILWYLFAMIVYYLLIPFFDVKTKKQRIAAVTGMVLLALLSGYDSKVGYDYSSARIFTFMPFLCRLLSVRFREHVVQYVSQSPKVLYVERDGVGRVGSLDGHGAVHGCDFQKDALRVVFV